MAHVYSCFLRTVCPLSHFCIIKVYNLSHYEEAARQAGEPVFSIKEGGSIQSFGAALHISLEDPALLNALMLTLAFTINGNVADAECLVYKSRAIRHLNEKIRRTEGAVTEGTLISIILLTGVDVCCKMLHT